MGAAERTEDEGGKVTAIVREAPGASPTLFGTTDPVEVVSRATRHATALTDVIKAKKLATDIRGRSHVRVEGWTLLGSMLGVYAIPVWTHPVPEDWRDRGMDQPDGWQARVEARTLAGNIVGAATASCMRSESNWESRDEYALESMAQTRATGKALRLPLGFVVVLAGYDATPAEEMPHEGYDDSPYGNGAPSAAPPSRSAPKADPEIAERKRLAGEIKTLTGSTKGLHDAYRAVYGKTGGVKASDLTVEVLTRILDVVTRAKEAEAPVETIIATDDPAPVDAEVVEGEIVEDGPAA